MQKNQAILNRIQEFFFNLDFFAIQPSLNVFKKQKYSTFLGAFMTFCIGIITIAYLSLELQELVDKSLPNIIQSDKQVVETSVNIYNIQSFPLMQDNFTLAISIVDMNLDPLKKINQYFTITIKNCVRTRKVNATTSLVEVDDVQLYILSRCTTYPTEDCTSDNFVTNTQKEFFSQIRLGAVQCIQKDILKNNPPVMISQTQQKLKGILQGKEYAYITILFSVCKNTTTLQTCAPQEEILTQFNQGYYALYLSDTLVQMGNRGDISQDIIKMQYTSFSKASSIQIYQTLRIIESQTDVGLIANSIVKDYNLIQQNYREQFTLYNDQYLVYHWIILDEKYTQYQRSYIKVQAILSKIGGLWQIMFLIIATFLKPFIETDMYLRICNQLFRIQEQNVRINIEQNETSKSKSHISKMIQSLNPKFETSMLEIILITLNCKRKKKSHLEIAKTAFSSKLDVLDIAVKAYQLDSLKQILLTEDQLRIFEILPKPFIHFDKGDKMDLIIQSRRIKEALQINKQKEKDEKFLKACRSYFQILSQSAEPNEVEKRLLGYLDQDLIQLFHQLNFTKNNSQFQVSLDISNKRSILLDQRNQGAEYSNCLTPISLESPAARVPHIHKKH